MKNPISTSVTRGGFIVLGAAALALAVSGSAMAAPVAKAKPYRGLTNNQVVTVSGSGYAAKEQLLILQCNKNAATGDKNACDTSNILSVTTNAKGQVPPTKFTVHTGTIGDGTCGTSKTDRQCYIPVSNTSSTDFALASITFK